MADQEELISELHSALVHLDDPPYLERHLLASRFSFVAQTSELSRGQALRRALRLAIAALDPGADPTTQGLEARSYQVLYRWAVARQGMVAIASSLGISRRQAYRELRRAIDALAQVLSEADAAGQQQSKAGPRQVRSRAAQVHEELERLSRIREEDLDLGRLVTEVVQSAQYLARDRGVEIDLSVDASELRAAANRVMLRQALLNLLSHIVSVHRNGSIMVRLRPLGHGAVVQLTYRQPEARPDPLLPKSPYAVATQLFNSLGLDWQQEQVDGRTARVSVFVPLAQEHTLLIVDDNEGLIALFRRYLRHRPFRVYGAASAGEALELLERLLPEVVILDVMMPDRDGWEVLQTLRTTDAGRKARVIVCSIINDPKLAAALGADAFLNKPVDRGGLLRALDQVLAAT